jgi:integrase
MRRGEVLALRWADINFDAGTLKVAQVIEQTRNAISLKEPKTDRSRRTISLGPELVQLLRSHRREQAEWRLKHGLGKDPQDLVFPDWNGSLRDARVFTKQFSREVKEAGLPHVTFHGLRHTHLSHLLRKGIPVHVVSERAGHANATITWGVYAHTLPGDQDDAVKIADEALKAALQE